MATAEEAEIDRLNAEIERLKADFNDCNFNRVHWKQEADKLRAALSWMADQDPQLIDAVREKFGIHEQ